MKRPIARPGAQLVLGLESEPLEPLIESDTPELIEALADLLLAALGHTGKPALDEGGSHEPQDHA
jgi:hypothetical protein